MACVYKTNRKEMFLTAVTHKCGKIWTSYIYTKFPWTSRGDVSELHAELVMSKTSVY